MTKDEFDALQAGDRFVTDAYTFVVEQDPARAALCYRRESDSVRYPMTNHIIGTHTRMLPRPVRAKAPLAYETITFGEPRITFKSGTSVTESEVLAMGEKLRVSEATIDAQNEAIKILRAQVAEQARELVVLRSIQAGTLRADAGGTWGGLTWDADAQRAIDAVWDSPDTAQPEPHRNLLAVAAMTRTGR